MCACVFVCLCRNHCSWSGSNCAVNRKTLVSWRKTWTGANEWFRIFWPVTWAARSCTTTSVTSASNPPCWFNSATWTSSYARGRSKWGGWRRPSPLSTTQRTLTPPPKRNLVLTPPTCHVPPLWPHSDSAHHRMMPLTAEEYDTDDKQRTQTSALNEGNGGVAPQTFSECAIAHFDAKCGFCPWDIIYTAPLNKCTMHLHYILSI